MRAWIARMTEDNIDQSAIEKAGEILKNGGLAAFPTETVYGRAGECTQTGSRMLAGTADDDF